MSLHFVFSKFLRNPIFWRSACLSSWLVFEVFVVVVLVVVASGDSLVVQMVGEVFRCDLCDPCMMLSCAFILVKINKKSGLYFILVSKDLRAGHYT